MSATTYLDRMRQNAAMALAQGATTVEVQAHVLSVARGLNRPGPDELTDAAEVAELAETLTGFRRTDPGGVSP